jgi:hypothetical protein
MLVLWFQTALFDTGPGLRRDVKSLLNLDLYLPGLRVLVGLGSKVQAYTRVVPRYKRGMAFTHLKHAPRLQW